MKKFVISEEEKNYIKKLYLIEGYEPCPNEEFTVGADTKKISKKELEDKVRLEKPKNAISVQQFCNKKYKISYWVSLEKGDNIEYTEITD